MRSIYQRSLPARVHRLGICPSQSSVPLSEPALHSRKGSGTCLIDSPLLRQVSTRCFPSSLLGLLVTIANVSITALLVSKWGSLPQTLGILIEKVFGETIATTTFQTSLLCFHLHRLAVGLLIVHLLHSHGRFARKATLEFRFRRSVQLGMCALPPCQKINKFRLARLSQVQRSL